MKYTLVLAAGLAAVWILWSGHTEPFYLFLGALSCLLVLGICLRMQIVDEETVPLGLRWGNMIGYLVWLAKQVVLANLDVASRIMKPDLPIAPTMVSVKPRQQKELGRVIFANSITLTPGTVSVDIHSNQIRVHALSLDGAKEDASGDMNRRVADVEGS